MLINKGIYDQLSAKAAKGKKQLCLLIDPDKYTPRSLEKSLTSAGKNGLDLIFVGGSLLVENRVRECIGVIRQNTDLPLVLFPGSPAQIDGEADAILLLSLISGRNADLLIGRQVEAAPVLRKSGLEIIPTGYMLVDGGKSTTASYMSNSFPIPWDKPEIAACTAMAGEMLGLRLLYLDCGSGASRPVSPEMISLVKETTSLPLVVGGGVTTPDELAEAYKAGADVVVVGNAVEKDPELLYRMAELNA